MQHSIRLPHFILLLIICLSLDNAKSLTHSAYVENTNQMRQPSSWNRGRLLGETDTNNGVNHYAIFESLTDSDIVGGMSTFDVYELININNQTSGSQMCVINQPDEDVKSQNVAIAGWTVSPHEYGDSKTHFFTLWTADGYISTGCYDLRCDGFVPVQDAPITPGDILDPKNGKLKITIKIFNKENDGDWWLYFGYDNTSLTAVGFWPRAIFTSMTEHANSIQWGGYTFSDVGSFSPEMGSGHWPGIHSATVEDVRFVDGNGRGYKIDPWPGGLDASISHKECYGAVISVDEMFYYGGPGGCIM